MAIRTYTKNDKSKRLSDLYTVGDLWPDDSRSSILLDDALVEALGNFWKHFDSPPVFGSKRAIYAVDGHASGSYHYKGQAADFSIEGVKPIVLAQYAEKIGMGGIGVYKDTTRHIHMDTRSRRTCWWVITSNSHTPGFGGAPCTFRNGDRSPAIISIQKALGVGADGIFGAKTEAALKLWQKGKGVSADGIFGKATNDVMKVFDWA